MYEIQLHEEFNVSKNYLFFNKAKQKTTGFSCGPGQLNPFYGKKHTEEYKQKQKEDLEIYKQKLKADLDEYFENKSRDWSNPADISNITIDNMEDIQNIFFAYPLEIPDTPLHYPLMLPTACNPTPLAHSPAKSGYLHNPVKILCCPA